MCYHIFNLYQSHTYTSILVIAESKDDRNGLGSNHCDANSAKTADQDFSLVFTIPICSRHAGSALTRETPAATAPLFQPATAAARRRQKMEIHFSFFDLIKSTEEIEWIS